MVVEKKVTQPTYVSALSLCNPDLVMSIVAYYSIACTPTRASCPCPVKAVIFPYPQAPDSILYPVSCILHYVSSFPSPENSSVIRPVVLAPAPVVLTTWTRNLYRTVQRKMLQTEERYGTEGINPWIERWNIISLVRNQTLDSDGLIDLIDTVYYLISSPE